LAVVLGRHRLLGESGRRKAGLEAKETQVLCKAERTSCFGAFRGSSLFMPDLEAAISQMFAR
jgi:hypothetical protein